MYMLFLIVALSIALLWSIGPVLQKFALARGVHPYAVLVAGSLTYVTCVIPFALWNWDKVSGGFRALGADWRSTAAVVSAAVTTSFVGNLMFLTLLRGHESYVTTALTYTSPMFTCLIAWLFLGEALTVLRASGVAAIALGTFLLIA